MPNNSQTTNKSWMIEKLLLLMEKRRKQKNSSPAYKSIQRDIQKTVREAKQKELDEKCQEIETLQSRFDEFNVHRKVRKVTAEFNKKKVSKLYRRAVSYSNSRLSTEDARITSTGFLEEVRRYIVLNVTLTH